MVFGRGECSDYFFLDRPLPAMPLWRSLCMDQMYGPDANRHREVRVVKRRFLFDPAFLTKKKMAPAE